MRMHFFTDINSMRKENAAENKGTDLPAKLLRYCSQIYLSKNIGLVSRLERLEKLSPESG